MRTIRLLKPKQFEQQEIAEPAAPGAGEALVRVHHMGICGSDFSGYLGKMPFFSYPRIPGHELGVEVLAVGPGVTEVRVGDHCSVEPYINCQNCTACKRGRGNCCENLQVLGVHADGGLRPRVVLPARKLHPGNMIAEKFLNFGSQERLYDLITFKKDEVICGGHMMQVIFFIRKTVPNESLLPHLALSR